MEKSKHTSPENLLKRLDLVTTLLPFFCIVALCILFVIFPDGSSEVLESIRFFLGDELGSYYLIVGLGIFICSLYLAFSRYGQIRLGDTDKPEYSYFQWGSMLFTAGLAADILFYSCCEWMLYASEPHIADMGGIQDWASTYPLFH
jgi:BCCT family betaine/carnitine transporter